LILGRARRYAGSPHGHPSPSIPISSSASCARPVSQKSRREAIAEAFAEAHVVAELATKADLRELEYRLIIKLGVMMMAAVAAVAALVKLL
jgi:hypothetical protein